MTTDESGATPAAPDDSELRQERADALKERIYLTFASLAVVLALNLHGPVSAAKAVLTLLVTVVGTLLAVFVADVVSHMVVHERGMSAAEMRHAVRSSFGALGAVGLPFLFLLFAVFGWWEVHTALTVSAIALIAALVVIGFVAVRRLRMTWWQRLVALGAEAALGLAVVGLQLLAKGG
jgi:hypothetical protein